jgi:hypothetical protein
LKLLSSNNSYLKNLNYWIQMKSKTNLQFFDLFLRFYFQVVAFSFYGDPESKLAVSRKYFEGIKDNLKLIPKYYDGWTLRYIS